MKDKNNQIKKKFYVAVRVHLKFRSGIYRSDVIPQVNRMAGLLLTTRV